MRTPYSSAGKTPGRIIMLCHPIRSFTFQRQNHVVCMFAVKTLVVPCSWTGCTPARVRCFLCKLNTQGHHVAARRSSSSRVNKAHTRLPCYLWVVELDRVVSDDEIARLPPSLLQLLRVRAARQHARAARQLRRRPAGGGEKPRAGW